MLVNLLRSSQGFTYLMALMVIVIMGIMLAASAQSWKMIMDREREEEMLFRGTQYMNAISRWYKTLPGQRPAPPLNDLKDLLKDPNTVSTNRYLRTLYKDPITGDEWVPIKGGTTGGIIGVASSSELKPIKQANFPKDLELLEGKNKYSEWQFVYRDAAATTTTGTTSGPAGGTTSQTKPSSPSTATK